MSAMSGMSAATDPTAMGMDPAAMDPCANLVEEQNQPLAIASIFIILVVSYIGFMLPGFIARHRHPSIQVRRLWVDDDKDRVG